MVCLTDGNSSDRPQKGGDPAWGPKDILDMVGSLYADEAAPSVPLLQWRLQQAFGEKVTLQALVCVAANTPGVVISNVAGRKGPTILLQAEPRSFAGFVDNIEAHPEGNLPQTLVIEAARHLVAGGWPVPGNVRHQKFEIADWLQDCSQFLGPLSFGWVLCLVRYLTKSSMQVLGRRDGHIVPYTQSEECEKTRNANNFVPTGLRPDEAFVASWPELLRFLRVLVEENGGRMKMSKLKHTFRARFHMELTETVFGHTSVLGLLRDGRTREVVTLEREVDPDTVFVLTDSPRQPQRASTCEHPVREEGANSLGAVGRDREGRGGNPRWLDQPGPASPANDSSAKAPPPRPARGERRVATAARLPRKAGSRPRPVREACTTATPAWRRARQ